MGLSPIDYGKVKHWTISCYVVLANLMGVTMHMRVSLIFSVFICLVLFLVVYPLSYNEELQGIGIVWRIYNSLYAGLYIATLNMLIIYVIRIRGQLARLFSENLSLFNKMHEGLIVLSKESRTITFANQPAIELLHSLKWTQRLFLGQKKEDEDVNLSEKDLDLKVLKSTQVSIERSEGIKDAVELA